MSAYNSVVDTAIRSMAPDLGAKGAARRIQAQMENAIHIPYILPVGFSDILFRRYGFDIVSDDKKPLTSDHPFLAIDRAVIRSIFSQVVKLTTTHIPTLCVGSADYEVATFYKNPAVEFYFHMSEGKDAVRASLPMLDHFISRFSVYLSSNDTVSVKGRKAKNVQMEIRGIADLVASYEVARAEDFSEFRIHVNRPNKSYTQLVAIDSAYEIHEAEWFDMFEHHSASVAHVTGFYPNELIFDDMAPSSSYIYQRAKRTMESDGDYACALKELAVFALRWKFGPVISVLTLVKRTFDAYRGGVTIGDIFDLAVTLVITMTSEGFEFFYGAGRIASLIHSAFSGIVADRASVTYKHGYSNGYEHNYDSWSLLLRKPVLTSIHHDFVIEVEIVQTAGSHRLIKLIRSTSTRPVVRNLTPEKGMRAVRILDVEETFKKPIPTPVYFSVLESEYESTIDFLSGQMDATLTFEAVQTLVNRSAGGVKIATTEVAPVWTMEKKYTWKFAVTCALEAARRHKRANDIVAENKEKLMGYDRSHWQLLLRSMAMAGAVLATAGLALPVMMVFQWLATKYSSLQLVVYPTMEKEQRWVPSADLALRLRNATMPSLFNKDFVFNASKEASVCACPTLAAMQPFGKQQPKCLHKPGEHKRLTKIVVTKAELDDLKAKIFTQREVAPPELQKVLDRFKDAIPAVGFEMELELDLIIGGPGVGKSHTARTLLSNIERNSGCRTFVYAPFNKLAPDYPTEPRDGNIGFNFRTTHRLIHERGVHTVLGDEFTCLEEMATIVSLYNCNATRFVATGDNRQTGVLPEEGQRFFSEGSKFMLRDFTTHILPVQFRSDAYTVALANKDFDCGMYAYNSAIERPRVLPISEMPASNTGATTMVFTEATGIQHGQETANTVRRNQGGTYTNVVVPVHTRDLHLVRNDPLFLVAFTRHKVGGSLTFYCEEGECLTTLRERLRLDDEEFQANVLKYARPDLDELYGTTAVTDNKAELDALAQQLFRSGVLSSAELDGISASEGRHKRTLEELLHSKTQTMLSSPYCVACGEEKAGANDVCMCQAETIEAVTAEVLLQAEVDLDFSENGWCLPKAATSVIVKPRRNTGSAGHEQTTPLDISLFTEYKEYTRRINPDSGAIPLDDFVEYLDQHGAKYVIEVQEDFSDDVKEFSCNLEVEPFDLSQPCAFITISGEHAEPMKWERVMSYVLKRKVTFRMPNSMQICPTYEYYGFETIASVQSDFPGLAITRRSPFVMSWPITTNNSRDPYSFRLKRKIGDKTKAKSKGSKVVWAEKFIRPFTTTHSLPVSGPRTLALDATRHRNVCTVGVTTEDQNYERALPNERLFGTDVYALAGYLDPTVSSAERANHDIVSMTITENIQAKIKPMQVIMPTNKRGRFELSNEPPTDFAVAAGFGLVQHNNAVETLACSQRYVKQRPIHRFSPEGARMAREMARKNLEKNYDLLSVVYDQALEDMIVAGWEYDALDRGYGNRVESDFASGNPEVLVTFSTKNQEKVSKKPDVDPWKIGQGISAVSPSTNYEYGSLFRVLNYRSSRFAKPTNIYDCGMSPAALKADVKEQMKAAVYDRCTVVDVVQCDALQNWFTVEGEIELRRALANQAWLPQIEKYYRDVRGRYQIKTYGLFSAQVEGPKPSGAPDTLEGNGNVTENYATSAIKTTGPVLAVKKGDDRVIWSTTATIDKAWTKEASLFTDFSISVEFGAAQFTGKTITKDGMYDDVIKKARKAVMHRVRTYKQWCEYQQSLRDAVAEIKAEGVQPTIAATAEAYGTSYAVAESYWMLLYSLSHIGFDQWLSITKDRSFAIPTPPRSEAPTFASSKLIRRHHDYVAYTLSLPGRKKKTYTRKEQRRRAATRAAQL